MQRFTLTSSRGDVVLDASSRELDPTAEYWLAGTPAGWYGGYSMRGDPTERIGNGDFPLTRTASARDLELRASIHLDSWEAANVEKRRLSAALAEGEAGSLRGEEGGLPVMTATVERTGDVLIARKSPSAFTVSIPLRAPDPVLYGDETTTFLHPVGTGRGLEYPLFARTGALAYGSAISAADPITNRGNVPAYDDYLVVGDFPGGWRLDVGGRVVEWPWPTALRAPVLVQMVGQIWVGNANVTDRASKRQWSSLAPGASVTPSLTPLQGGTGWAEARHRDTYM